MKVLIFGTGDIYKKNKHKFTDFDVLAFLDNDLSKHNQFLDDVLITPPQNHCEYEYDAIIIASVYFREMRKQLLDLGVPENKIVDEEHMGVFADTCIIHEYKRKIECNPQGKRILLVSNELTNSGAPVVLYNVACVLIKNGYRVDLITCMRGPMLYSFVSLGVGVKIAECWQMFGFSFFEEYDLVFLNTVITYPVAKLLTGTNIPLLWWLHEDKQGFNTFNITESDIPVAKNIHMLSVGKRVEKAYVDLLGNNDINEMCFGLVYHEAAGMKGKNDKVICALIGYVSEIKGQDLLLKAVEMHQKEWNDKIEFWIIGSITERQKEEFEQYHCIRVWGVVEHERLMDLYSEIDIVLCASRYESMSAAIIEGMMHKKLCIISSETGIAEYCEPYVNALIMESENVDSLSEQIDWALQHREGWAKISEAGYEVYNSKFRMETFEKNLLYYVNKFGSFDKEQTQEY